MVNRAICVRNVVDRLIVNNMGSGKIFALNATVLGYAFTSYKNGIAGHVMEMHCVCINVNAQFARIAVDLEYVLMEM